MSYQSPVYDDPTAGGMRAPAPERDPLVLTAAEAARFLRLDDDRDIGDAVGSVMYLVKARRLRALRIGKSVRFARAEMVRFITDEGVGAPASDIETEGNLP